MKNNKRYIALYVHKGCCDGFLDTKTNKYLTDNEIENLLNINKGFENTWIKKYDELKKENIKIKKKIKHYETIK